MGGKRPLSKSPLSSAVFVSSLVQLCLFSVCSKEKCFLLNLNPLRGSRCIYLRAVSHHQSYHVYLVGKVILSLISHDKTESWLKKYKGIQRSYPLNSCFDLRDFFFLLSLLAVFFFFFISDDLSSNENASYSKGFIKVDSELLLVHWVFKLQILYSKSSFRSKLFLKDLWLQSQRV